MDYKTIKKLITIEGVLLFIQYWLGMSINLFIKIPLKTPLNFFSYPGIVEVLAHIANGILILAVAFVMLAYLLKQKWALFSKLSMREDLCSLRLLLYAIATIAIRTAYSQQ